ncbi:MAG: hypothetical protein ACRD9Q_07395 [Nitrososphaeraceae archaeon]
MLEYINSANIKVIVTFNRNNSLFITAACPRIGWKIDHINQDDQQFNIYVENTKKVKKIFYNIFASVSEAYGTDVKTRHPKLLNSKNT